MQILKKVEIMRKFFLILLALLVFIPTQYAPSSSVAITLPDKYKAYINGTPPKDYRATAAPSGGKNGDVLVPFVPAFNWIYGCSPTSASMLFAYYDNIGYDRFYEGTLYQGAKIDTNQRWIDDAARNSLPNLGVYGESSLCATRKGLDYRTARGHVDDYWVSYGSALSDPYITNGWVEHTKDCVADFLGTNQTSYGHNKDEGGTYVSDIPSGMAQFAISKGYNIVTSTNYYDLNSFSFDAYCNEIDNFRPVLFHLFNVTSGHTILGYGYNKTTREIILRDTWDHDQHYLAWGGNYYGLQQSYATIFQLQPITTASVLSATAISPTQVMLRWMPVINAISYKIEYKTDKTAWAVKGFTYGNTTNYLVTGLASNTNYYFRVAALTKVGSPYNPYMNEAYAATWMPTPKTPILAAPANGYLVNNPFQTFTFAYNPGMGETNTNLSFDIQVSTDPSFNNPSKMQYESYSNIGNIINIPAYWLNLSWNTLYYWRVRARNENGNAYGLSPWTSPWIIRIGCGQKPSSPQISMSFVQKGENNADSLIIGFYTLDFVRPEGVIVEQSLNGSPFVQNRRITPVQFTITIPTSSLTPNSYYCFRLKFFNCATFSDYSSLICYQTPPPPPPIPVLKYPYNNAQFSGDFLEVYPSKNWLNVNNYEVILSETSDFSNYFYTVSKVDTGGVFRFYLPAGLSTKRYYWKCRIFVDPFTYSSWSQTWYFNYNKPLPPPSGLIASISTPRRVDLSWIDNSPNESGFKVERKDGTNGTFRLIGYTPANATTFTDPNVIAGTIYYYRVTAYNTNSTSVPSNMVSITAR